MSNAFFMDLVVKALDGLKHLNSKQLLTVGFISYAFAMTKLNDSSNEVIDVPPREDYIESCDSATDTMIK